MHTEEDNFRDERVRLNVGGKVHETYVSTLMRFPNSLLGTMLASRNRGMVRPDEKGEVFIDRNGDLFSVILDFYRSGGATSPYLNNHYLPSAIQAEMDYFLLPHPKENAAIHQYATEDDPGFGAKVASLALSCAIKQLTLDDFTNLKRMIKQALLHAAQKGKKEVTIRLTPSGSTFFGEDSEGNDLYIIKNSHCKQIIENLTSRTLLMRDMKYMGLTPTIYNFGASTWCISFRLFDEDTPLRTDGGDDVQLIG